MCGNKLLSLLVRLLGVDKSNYSCPIEAKQVKYVLNTTHPLNHRLIRCFQQLRMCICAAAHVRSLVALELLHVFYEKSGFDLYW